LQFFFEKLGILAKINIFKKVHCFLNYLHDFYEDKNPKTFVLTLIQTDKDTGVLRQLKGVDVLPDPVCQARND
jgi:hypothetical protein